MTMQKPDYEVRAFRDQKAFETWLHANHAKIPGVWAKIAKAASGIRSVNRKQALDVALCYGWIDGQAKSLDDTYYLQKFTPRRARSIWSKINTGLVAELIAAGKMQPAGQAQIDAAKADGRWAAAYGSPTTIEMPDDFKKALAASAKANEFYETLNKSSRYAALWQVQTAIKPETRARRIAKFVAQFERGEKP